LIQKNERLSYVLITPARNEEAHIGKTIRSVLAQSVAPIKWVIVSDGSTDRTDAICRKYVAKIPWIELIRMPEHADRQFAAKVKCFNAGFEIVKLLNFDVIGNLDADISFEKNYFEFLLSKFIEDPRLGVAGTPFVEKNKHYDYRFSNIEHVSGACQLFRRECFVEIGGYVPIKGGGIDWTAVTTARMRGWKTRTFTEQTCFHSRRIGTGNNSVMRSFFNHGQKDYFLGGHPIWQVFRAIYQMSRPPYFIGGLSLITGYFWAFLRQLERPIPADLLSFHRAEQMTRLKSFIGKRIRLIKSIIG
jgi:poly-beta-1,6-N-acetyl-D-glucosamine synthase